MGTSTWHVRVDVECGARFDEEAAAAVSESLEDVAAVVSLSRTYTSGSVALTLSAPTIVDAGNRATSQVLEALARMSITARVVELLCQTDESRERELQRPIYPEVVGYAEIARIAGVSRQRARQFADIAAFPKPVIETAQGPLYSRHAVDRWLEKRRGGALA